MRHSIGTGTNEYLPACLFPESGAGFLVLLVRYVLIQRMSIAREDALGGDTGASLAPFCSLWASVVRWSCGLSSLPPSTEGSGTGPGLGTTTLS